MERTSTANDLSDRLRRRRESELRDIEELTARELKRLAENSRRVARNALRTIERDTEEAAGRMRELFVKAWLRPLIALREIKGERYVVLPFGTLADPGWEVRHRPTVKLSRE